LALLALPENELNPLQLRDSLQRLSTV
jgi:hypothetical protein